MRRAAALILAATLGVATAALAGPDAAFSWRLPAWLPPPVVPPDNPMSQAKVELGRHLFYDKRLSADGSMSCASCHEQARAFSDGRATPKGVTGEAHPRNSMSLANVAYLPVLTWANPLLTRLEHQALIPVFGESPVEMGMVGREAELFARLAADPAYPPLFRAAFPEAAGRIDLGSITKALAAFQRTLISADSPYDRYRYGGEPDAISPAAKRGEALFFSERLECFHCHGGVHLTDNLVHSRKPFAEYAFHNTGLYDRDGKGAYPPDNTGLVEHTGRPDDMGRFRTPSLRNVELTAPYMHDGSIATLEEAIAHYAAGGRRRSPLTSEFLPGFTLSAQETQDLIAFLRALTDRRFIEDPRFADPWPAGTRFVQP
jgi:cytochrome c peroxidase